LILVGLIESAIRRPLPKSWVNTVNIIGFVCLMGLMIYVSLLDIGRLMDSKKMDVQRRKTKAVSVGNLVIGGGAPVVVQTMLKTNIIDLNAALEELRQDVAAGAQLIRFAVPDERAARNIGILVRQSLFLW